MNLSQKKAFELTKDSVENFRKEQYDLIPSFAELCVKYISAQSNNYLTATNISFEDKIEYNNLHHSAVKNLRVDILNNSEENPETQLFFNVQIPKLFFDNFFLLNDNYYVPALYLLDKPLIIKKESAMITTLFNSLTFNFKNNVVTFTGVNIPIHIFLLLFKYNKQTNANTLSRFINFIPQKFNKKFKMIEDTEDNIINYFYSRIPCKKSTDSIINYFNKLMFDDYTKYVISSCYNIPFDQVDLSSVLMKLFEIILENEQNSFVDLREKRLVFIELLLAPLFKKTSSLAIQAIRGFKLSQLKLDGLAIVKNFNKFLKSNYLYDTGNLYSGLLQHKASMLNPASKRGPKTISSIHQTHYGKVCPITVASMDPGESVSIIPNTRFDMIGQFKDF